VEETEFHENVYIVHPTTEVLPVTFATATTLSASFFILRQVTAVSDTLNCWLINDGTVHVKFINLTCCQGNEPEPWRRLTK
jgi:hypothetical protein